MNAAQDPAPAAKQYAELHCLSNFSFLRGASHPQELVAQAAALGYQALAITDECSLAGVVRAHVAAKEHGLKLLIGSEMTLTDGTKLVLLAMDREGYGDLCELITRGRRRAGKGRYRLERSDFASGLPHCLVLWIPGDDAQETTARWIAGTFPGHSWIAVERHLDGPDRLPYLLRLAAAACLPLVAAGDVHMHTVERRPLQDLLTAIRLRKSVHTARGQLYPNAERHLRNRSRLARLYPPELLAESLNIAARCHFSLDELRYEYPKELVPPCHTPTSWLRLLTETGAKGRWPEGIREEVRQKLEHELALIAELDYEPYFLTVHDIVKFARGRGILCQGRGSAANSVVCFCLGITELDPVKRTLLFERFISRERCEPPDIDVDFEHARREEVIQYLYAKYGRERAAIAATLITYRSRSAVRDAARALGLTTAQVDRLAGVSSHWDDPKVLALRIREAGLDPASPVMRQFLTLVKELINFPRHLSQHVGGFVLSRGPLCRLVPIENAAMAERTVIEWDKNDLDALGLMKVDVLALGMLTALYKCLTDVNRIRGKEYDLATLPAEDPRVYDMICEADTLGVFQIESRAQMSMLPRLKPRCFYDLVIQIAIVRPGPIQGGMVHPYLARRNGEEPVTYPNAAVEQVLERTLGIPIFQEQVMQLAVVAAGFTPGEADQLRRAMGAWQRGGDLGPFEKKLVDGMLRRGYTREFADQLFSQIKGFGEYGFPESHSASFALLAYASAWFKLYEPAIFLCALLNSQPMGFYSPSELVQDARRHGVKVRPVDINRSAWECSLETSDNAQPAVRLGLCMASGLAEETASRVVQARGDRPFTDVAVLALRAELEKADLRRLAAAGALACIAGNRHQSYWSALGIEAPWALGDAPLQEARPLLRVPSEGENLLADYASMGLTLGCHPLALLRGHFDEQRVIPTAGLRSLPDGTPVQLVGLVTHRQRPGSAKGVTFMTLEDETGYANVVVWRELGKRQRRVLIKARLMEVAGKVQREGEVLHVIAAHLFDHDCLLGTLVHRSRDFR
jgi:error-prone DNA polymerase